MTWKIEDVEFLKNNYDKLSVKELSEKLGKTNKSIRSKLERMGLGLRELNRQEIFKWNKEQLDFLKTNYKTMTDREIAKILFNDDCDKAAARVFRKRTTLKLEKDIRGLKYNDNNSDYKSRFHNGEKIFEHRENAEKKIGRKLLKNEIVHHIDGDKKNNSFNNLYICKDKSEHMRLHDKLEKITMQLVKEGIVKFDEEKKEYFINKNMLT